MTDLSPQAQLRAYYLRNMRRIAQIEMALLVITSVSLFFAESAMLGVTETMPTWIKIYADLVPWINLLPIPILAWGLAKQRLNVLRVASLLSSFSVTPLTMATDALVGGPTRQIYGLLLIALSFTAVFPR